jgi:hypothetical protein
MSIGNLWRTLHPIESRLMGGSSRQPNTAAPRWNQVGPGRWEMEGGVPAGQGFSPMTDRHLGGPGQMAQNPFLQTGGPGQMQQAPGFPMQTGGGGQMQQLPQWLTGGPGQQMGGMPPQSSYQQPQWGLDNGPAGDWFGGNFGRSVYR